MAFVRWTVLLLLLVAIGCFVMYIATGQARYKARGLTLLKWTLGAAFVFFAVLIVQRVA